LDLVHQGLLTKFVCQTVKVTIKNLPRNLDTFWALRKTKGDLTQFGWVNEASHLDLSALSKEGEKGEVPRVLLNCGGGAMAIQTMYKDLINCPIVMTTGAGVSSDLIEAFTELPHRVENHADEMRFEHLLEQTASIKRGVKHHRQSGLGGRDDGSKHHEIWTRAKQSLMNAQQSLLVEVGHDNKLRDERVKRMESQLQVIANNACLMRFDPKETKRGGLSQVVFRSIREDPTTKTETKLMLAIKWQLTADVRELLEADPVLDLPGNALRNTDLLLFAAHKDFGDIVSSMLKHGYDVKRLDALVLVELDKLINSRGFSMKIAMGLRHDIQGKSGKKESLVARAPEDVTWKAVDDVMPNWKSDEELQRMDDHTRKKTQFSVSVFKEFVRKHSSLLALEPRPETAVALEELSNRAIGGVARAFERWRKPVLTTYERCTSFRKVTSGASGDMPAAVQTNGRTRSKMAKIRLSMTNGLRGRSQVPKGPVAITPLNELHRVFWAVSTDREQVAEALAMSMSRPLFGLLFACHMYRRMETSNPGRKHKFETQADMYDRRARDVLDCVLLPKEAMAIISWPLQKLDAVGLANQGSTSEGHKEALQLLGKEVLGQSSDIVDLAIQADSKYFLAQKYVQDRFSIHSKTFWFNYFFHCFSYCLFVVITFSLTLHMKDFGNGWNNTPEGTRSLGMVFLLYLVGLVKQEQEEWHALGNYRRYITSGTGNCWDVAIISMQILAVFLKIICLSGIANDTGIGFLIVFAIAVGWGMIVFIAYVFLEHGPILYFLTLIGMVACFFPFVDFGLGMSMVHASELIVLLLMCFSIPLCCLRLVAMCQVHKTLGSMYLTMQELIVSVALPWLFFAALIVISLEGFFIFFRYHAMGDFPFNAVNGAMPWMDEASRQLAGGRGGASHNQTDSADAPYSMGLFELAYMMFSDPPNFQELPSELASEDGSWWPLFGWVTVVLYLIMTTAVLVNILVAAMTHTYEVLVDQLLERSAAIRVQMIKKFQVRHAFTVEHLLC
jgi:hypothetical protein